MYSAVLYSVYRYSIRKYRLPWAALGFHWIGWRTMGRVAALFVPVTLCGLVVTRFEAILLGGSLHSGQAATLTRGMPALPFNFLLLFLLLLESILRPSLSALRCRPEFALADCHSLGYWGRTRS